jgi:cell pole-organizing protein PopZ
MSDGKGPASKDPSMDDILASIRKIISDDEARAQVGGLRNSSAGPGERPPVVPPVLPSAPPSASREDVLLLTEIVEEPKSMPEEQPAMPRIDPVNAAEMPQPSIEPVVSEKPAARTSSGEALVGDGVAGAASSAFARLNQAVQDSVPPPAATNPGPSVGGQTIEDLVKEMLRPMLKEWLDTNLPPMVERYVEREIARLTRR